MFAKCQTLTKAIGFVYIAIAITYTNHGCLIYVKRLAYWYYISSTAKLQPEGLLPYFSIGAFFEEAGLILCASEGPRSRGILDYIRIAACRSVSLDATVVYPYGQM